MSTIPQKRKRDSAIQTSTNSPTSNRPVENFQGCGCNPTLLIICSACREEHNHKIYQQKLQRVKTILANGLRERAAKEARNTWAREQWWYPIHSNELLARNILAKVLKRQGMWEKASGCWCHPEGQILCVPCWEKAGEIMKARPEWLEELRQAPVESVTVETNEEVVDGSESDDDESDLDDDDEIKENGIEESGIKETNIMGNDVQETEMKTNEIKENANNQDENDEKLNAVKLQGYAHMEKVIQERLRILTANNEVVQDESEEESEEE